MTSNLSPSYVPRGHENVCPRRNLYITAHGHFIYNGQKQKQSNVPQWINRYMWSIHTMDYDSAIKRNEALTHITPEMNLKNIMLNEVRHKRPYNV